MARRADCALCRWNASRCGHAVTRLPSLGARGGREFSLRIGAVSLCRARRGATARQTSPHRRPRRLRLRVRAVGALSSGSSGDLAALRTVRRRSALWCGAPLRSALTPAYGVHDSCAGATAGRARRASSLVAACGRRVCMLLGLRSRSALAAWRDCIGRCARLLCGALRTGRSCGSGGAARSRTAGSGGISLRRRSSRSSRASPHCSPSRRARRAGVRAARHCAGLGRLASRRFVDQAIDRASGRRVRGRRIRLFRDIPAASIVALAHRPGANGGRGADRRARALVSRDGNDPRRSLSRRAAFVYRKADATGRTGSAGTLRHHLLPRRCCTDCRSRRSAASRFRRRLVTRCR